MSDTNVGLGMVYDTPEEKEIERQRAEIRTLRNAAVELDERAENLERQRDRLAEALRYARRMMKPDSDLAYVDAALAELEKEKGK